VSKEYVHRMSPEAVILMILTCSVLMGTTAGKAISKGLEVLESLWKQGWAGYRNFPDSFSHLNGVHVNHHSWRESGPVPLGLPIEGILERKDHPYHQLVKMLTNSKSPIATHLVGGFRLSKGPGGGGGQSPVHVHAFHEDRKYGELQEQKFVSQPSSTFTQAIPLIDANSLSNYLAPGADYMLPQHPDSQLPSSQSVLMQSVLSFPAVLPAQLSAIMIPSLGAADDQFAVTSDALSPPAPHEEVDPLQALLYIQPLPVYAPIAPDYTMSNFGAFGEEPGAYENDEESRAAASTQTTLSLSDAAVDSRSSSNRSESKAVSEDPQQSSTHSPTSSDLIADEDRQLINRK
jgi:hypothetical protein